MDLKSFRCRILCDETEKDALRSLVVLLLDCWYARSVLVSSLLSLVGGLKLKLNSLIEPFPIPDSALLLLLLLLLLSSSGLAGKLELAGLAARLFGDEVED